MYQVFEYLTVGERAYLQTLNREALKAAQDLNYQYTQQNRTLAAFLLSQEEKIFEYDHYICLVCKRLFMGPSHSRRFYICGCYICDVRWCLDCDDEIRIDNISNNCKVYREMHITDGPYNYFNVVHNHHTVNN